MDVQASSYQWIDWPGRGWLADEWNWTHSIGCAFAFFLYIIPGFIFLAVKYVARQNYLKNREIAEKSHNYAFEHTGYHWLASATHLGGHPLLPYRGRVLLGIKPDRAEFYTYRLQLLHSTPLREIECIADTRHLTTTSFGTVYKPEGTSFGTTSSTQHIDLHPDTLKLALLVKGQKCVAEFDMRPYDPLDFIQTFNEMRVE